MAVLTEAAGTGLVGTPPSLTAGARPVTVTAFPYIVVGAGRGIMAGWGGDPMLLLWVAPVAQERQASLVLQEGTLDHNQAPSQPYLNKRVNRREQQGAHD